MIQTCATIFAATLLSVCAAFGQSTRPNVVVMMVDNLGYGDLGIYGGLRAKTPRIDQLAREGVRFRDFQVEPGCTPSRAAFMTGRLSIRSGNSGIAAIGSKSGLHPKEVTLAEVLKGAGYTTALIGKWHLGELPERQPQMQGFDTFWGFLFSSAPSDTTKADFRALNVPVQPILEAKAGQKARVVGRLTLKYRALIDRDMTNKAVAYIAKNAKGTKPFFLFVSFANPHHPVIPHPDFKGKSGGGAYSDVLMEIDHNTGRILDAINKAGIRDNTIVVWFSDNGPTRYSLTPYENGDPGPWTGELGSAWEGGLRTAGMIRWPGKIKPRVSDEMVHEMDLYVTLSKFAGGKVPTDRPIDGVDQSEYFLGNAKSSSRDHVIVYYNGHLTAFRWRHYKLHFRTYPKWRSLITGVPTIHGIVPKMYNLKADPKERWNIAGGPEGLGWGLLVKTAQTRAKYERSFKEFPNNDYSKLMRSK